MGVRWFLRPSLTWESAGTRKVPDHVFDLVAPKRRIEGARRRQHLYFLGCCARWRPHLLNAIGHLQAEPPGIH
jgi:hypothetical protein